MNTRLRFLSCFFGLTLAAWAVLPAAPVLCHAQVIITVAGSGINAFRGDGDPATAACIQRPISVVLDSSGNFFIGDSGNLRVRDVNSAGVTSGYSGDGGPGTSTRLTPRLMGGGRIDFGAFEARLGMDKDVPVQ